MATPSVSPDPLVTICRHCGTPFRLRSRDVLRSGRGKFCSHRCYSENKRVPLAERFWSRVTPGAGCWLWRGLISRDTGYGVLHVPANGGNAVDGAHRVSWELHHGPIPPGMCVLHRCDVRACVRPDHLFLGTRPDNNADCIAKGRKACGSDVANSVLSEVDVREMRRLYAEGGWTQKQLGFRFGISQPAAGRVLRREAWKHLK